MGNVLVVGDVGLDGDDLDGVLLADFGGGFIGLGGRRDIVDDYVGALGGQAQGDGGADATAGAGNCTGRQVQPRRRQGSFSSPMATLPLRFCASSAMMPGRQ